MLYTSQPIYLHNLLIAMHTKVRKTEKKKAQNLSSTLFQTFQPHEYTTLGTIQQYLSDPQTASLVMIPHETSW